MLNKNKDNGQKNKYEMNKQLRAQKDVSQGLVQPLLVLNVPTAWEETHLSDSCVNEITHNTRWHTACVYSVLFQPLCILCVHILICVCMQSSCLLVYFSQNWSPFCPEPIWDSLPVPSLIAVPFCSHLTAWRYCIWCLTFTCCLCARNIEIYKRSHNT